MRWPAPSLRECACRAVRGGLLGGAGHCRRRAVQRRRAASASPGGRGAEVGTSLPSARTRNCSSGCSGAVSGGGEGPAGASCAAGQPVGSCLQQHHTCLSAGNGGRGVLMTVRGQQGGTDPQRLTGSRVLPGRHAGLPSVGWCTWHAQSQRAAREHTCDEHRRVRWTLRHQPAQAGQGGRHLAMSRSVLVAALRSQLVHAPVHGLRALVVQDGDRAHLLAAAKHLCTGVAPSDDAASAPQRRQGQTPCCRPTASALMRCCSAAQRGAGPAEQHPHGCCADRPVRRPGAPGPASCATAQRRRGCQPLAPVPGWPTAGRPGRPRPQSARCWAPRQWSARAAS